MKRTIKGKVLAVTGASSGIGAATALEAARRGMAVALCARRLEKVQEVASRIEAEGGQALAVRCDVSRPEEIQAFVDQTVERFGRLDVIYANAGYGIVRSVLEMSDEEHRAIFETNYFGTWNTVRAAAEALRQTEHGLKHILICSSVASEISLSESGAYCATKAAQDSLAGALRLEVEPEGMRVTTVHPVGTTTEFFTTAAEHGGYKPNRKLPPGSLMQSAEHVARRIVQAIERPKAEVWPMLWVRFALGFATMLPGLAIMGARRHVAPRT